MLIIYVNSWCSYYMFIYIVILFVSVITFCAVYMAIQFLLRNWLIMLVVMCIYVHYMGGSGLMQNENFSVIEIRFNHFYFEFFDWERYWLSCRPFGCGVILGGYDRDESQLDMVEPSGVSYVSWYFAIFLMWRNSTQSSSLCIIPLHTFLLIYFVWIQVLVLLQMYFGAAIGKGRQAAKT